MLKGRLGLEGARIPQADRHGVLWLARGNVTVVDGTLHFTTAGYEELLPGDYTIPFQMVSCIVLQPGTTVSHDALRLLAAHGTGLVAAGEGGVRFYASMPHGPDSSARARRQVSCWADPARRSLLARRMYAWRLGEHFPDAPIEVLRGLEGARMKATYLRIAQQFGIAWNGRKYDRSDPESADTANQAINHAATAVQGLAQVAVAISGAIPQLGFIHEDSGQAFCLDIADLYRDAVTLPVAFQAVRERNPSEETIERVVRRIAGRKFRKAQLVSKMIDRIKELLDDDSGRDEKHQ